MARYNPLKIEQSVPELYPRLVQYVNGKFYDGSGNLINISFGGGAVVNNPIINKLIISDGTTSGLSTVPSLTFVNGVLIIDGGLQITDGSQESGYILVSDANGLATWTSSIVFYYQSSIPSPTPSNVGSRWINSDTGIEYVWIYDGSNYNWIQPSQLWSSQYITNEITTSTYSTSFMYEYYGVTYDSGICTVYLPAAISPNDDGKFITIADEVGGISSFSRGINVIGSGTQSINGYSDILMKVNNMSLTFMFRNNNWKTI